jgi:hypothetical protein
MQKLYRLVLAITFAVVLITQQSLQAQNCCIDCQADVKVVTNNQVLLEKIDLKEGTSTTLNTNVYVSYRSGNAQKFWANVAIATAGVAVSTQLNGSTPIGAGDSKVQSSISPIVPLGVSVATLPGIWKNRPRGVPQAGLWLQHRDKKGKLLETWEQPISKEAKNSAELLTVAIDKPLTEGTLEVYLQNGSKNSVYYWGLQTVKNVVENALPLAKLALPPKPKKPIDESNGECNPKPGEVELCNQEDNQYFDFHSCACQIYVNNYGDGSTDGLGNNSGSTGLPGVVVTPPSSGGGNDGGYTPNPSGGDDGYDPNTPPDDGTNQPNPFDFGPDYGSSGGGDNNININNSDPCLCNQIYENSKQLAFQTYADAVIGTCMLEVGGAGAGFGAWAGSILGPLGAGIGGLISYLGAAGTCIKLKYDIYQTTLHGLELQKQSCLSQCN